MRKKITRWLILMGCVALLLSMINGCGENSLPPPKSGASTQVTITGDAV